MAGRGADLGRRFDEVGRGWKRRMEGMRPVDTAANTQTSEGEGAQQASAPTYVRSKREQGAGKINDGNNTLVICLTGLTHL